MIAQLTGQVAGVGATYLVIDVAGVGYRLLVPPHTAATMRVGEQVAIQTSLVVREDALTLYGFRTEAERDTFETLQSVTGVGPKMALALLSVHSPAELAGAISQGDAAALQQVPGVGAKLAARLLLELGGKLAPPTEQFTSGVNVDKEVTAALVSLGWSEKAAQQAIAKIPADTGADIGVRLKAALQQLGAKRG